MESRFYIFAPMESSPEKAAEQESTIEGAELKQTEDGLYEYKQLKADPGQRPIRLDRWLTIILKNKSRTNIKNATEAGCIRVNGKVVKASYKVKPGDEIAILLPHPPPPELSPEDIPIEVRYEDDDIMIINKYPGMVVHPGVGNWTGTLLHALLFYRNRDRLDAPREEWDFPTLVHRIDKDTSGLMVVPKHEFANSFLGRQFYDHSIDRLYNALVWGDVKEDSGTIVGHVGRDRINRKLFRVYKDGSVGKHAITHYRVLERFGFATLVECKLETGRTHQIRVHMKHLGHTLFSDWFYGGDHIMVAPNLPKFIPFIQNVQRTLPRQGLHARTLGFVHPQTRQRVHFDSELPEDMAMAIQKMRRYRDTYY